MALRIEFIGIAFELMEFSVRRGRLREERSDFKSFLFGKSGAHSYARTSKAGEERIRERVRRSGVVEKVRKRMR